MAALVYGLLAGAAVCWAVYRGAPDIYHHPEPLMPPSVGELWSILLGAGAGLGIGLGVAFLTRVSVYRFGWAQALHLEFRGLLGPLSGLEIFAYAGLAAVGEEIFFRGAMQPAIGIVPTALVFGMAHVAWGRKSIPWPLQAVVMGFVFGALHWATGNLVAPTVAHFTINYQNLHFINSYDPSVQLPQNYRRGLGTSR
jgi:membrane protease YdiL (CAAX protease family)